PVAAAYDEDGRLYIVEMTDYPYTDPKNDKAFVDNTDDPPIGRVRLLIDHDGDGRFDEGHILADKLSWPTGIVVWNGGVFVGATPDIWYLKDTDGDHKADVRRKVYTGFRKFNVQAVMNNLQWGLDHKVYGAASGNGGQILQIDHPEADPIPVLRRDFRFDPVTERFETISGGARFGNTFDDWGNRFLCNIRNPAEHVVLPARYLARNPFLPTPQVLHDAAESGDTIPVYRISPPEPWRELRARRWSAIGKAYPKSELIGNGYITSTSGVTVYRGNAYPPQYHGDLFLGEVSGNLIHRESVEPDGVTFRAQRADPGVEFVASTDTWFRPVNFINAPDGTLHVLDMYRESIEHPWSIPDDIKAQLDLRSGSDRGRIYRLTPPGFHVHPPPKLSQASTTDLVALLAHHNGWHRDTAHRLIFERQDKTAVAPIRHLLRVSPLPQGRLHALWSLHGLDALSNEDLSIALDDASSGIREHAVRLAEPRLNQAEELRTRVIALADDSTARVRFQVAFTLGEIEGEDAVAGLARIARKDAGDPWIRTAVLSSASKSTGPLFESLLADPEFAKTPDGLALLRPLAVMVGARGRPEGVQHLLTALALANESEVRPEVVLGLADGLGRSGRRLADVEGTNPAVLTMLADLYKDAEHTAADNTAPLDRRVRSILLMAQRPFEQSKTILSPLLDPQEPALVQSAVVRALGSYRDLEVAELLLAPWRGYSPPLRGEVLGILLGRTTWIGPALDAVEAKTIEIGQIPPNRRALLMASKDAKVRDRARSLFGADAPSPRKEVIDRYQVALKRAGHRDLGEKIFERECTTCHQLGERGHAVGPNLTSVQRRTADEILIHILDPNREAAPDFLEYTVALKDGRVVSGLINAETATGVTLRRAEGVEETILRQDVESIAGTGKSLMPEGLETKINPDEMADLLTFLLELQK
ncbi:MAG: PVC-type heme-binding CxxCH protein, partial [Isosphaeraceae bacterium]